ncbi:MAG TPA: SRPBCC family protein [Candidatus Limnocylindrales bacterium]|nr:SRPBCC family protein [Candidatus Limnocylindrales bacterium]
MAKVEKSIDVNVPVRAAYNQWTQFEEFPRFMEAVKSVRQIDDRNLEWTASIAGNEESWTAEITEQQPDQRIAWHSTSGRPNGGSVDFHHIDDNKTKVTLIMEWEPDGAVQGAGAFLGFDDRQVEGDMKRFKEFIESRGDETGEWRGVISREEANSRS